MFITIEELLNLKDMTNLKVLAGAKGIKNEIKNTIIVDNPDFFNLLSEGDIVITTGYPFFVLKDDNSFQVNTIKTLSKINCSALAIKTKKYFDKIPDSLIQTGELLDFPIIEIPEDMSLTQVDNIIKKKIGIDNESLLARTIEVQDKLMDATFGGIEKILEAILYITNKPVALVDTNWKVLKYKFDSNSKEYLNLYPNKKIFFKESIEKLNLEKIINKEHLKIKYEISEEEEIDCFIFPINDRKQIHGYIIIWDAKKKFGEIDYITLERASNILAVDMKKTKELENRRNKIRSDFFEDLITGKLKNTNDAIGLSQLYGIDSSKNYACIVINLTNIKDDIQVLKEKKDNNYFTNKIIGACYEVGEKYKSNLIHIVRGNYIILFLPIKRTEEIGDDKYFSKQFSEEIYIKICKYFPETKIVIGIGGSYSNSLDLKNSFSEALEVISLNQNIDSDEKVLHFDDYTIYHFLRSNISDDSLLKFYEITLSKLVKFDLENDSNMVKILEKYFKNQGNISVTAKELFLHRNTLIHKLDKIREILNIDLKDSEKILELQLALKAMKILKLK